MSKNLFSWSQIVDIVDCYFYRGYSTDLLQCVSLLPISFLPINLIRTVIIFYVHQLYFQVYLELVYFVIITMFIR